LSSGKYYVTITGQSGIQFEDTVRVLNEQIPIAPPTVECATGERACLGSDVVLYATTPNDMGTVRWYNSGDSLLHTGATLLAEDMQEDFLAYAKTEYRGCLSDAVPIEVAVYLPEAAFATEPQSGVTTETEVVFVPQTTLSSYAYAWSFGDGNESTETEPTHRYELPGLYQINLEVSDTVGCSNQNGFSLWVEAATHSMDLPEGRLEVRLSPNPFSKQLTVLAEVPVADTYDLLMYDMSGKLVWAAKQDWPAGEQTATVDADIPDGVYMLVLENKSGIRLALPAIKKMPRP